MESNQSGTVWGHLGPFSGVIGPFGGLRRVRGQILAISGADLTVPDPPSPTWSIFFAPKWLISVSHTKYNISYVQLAPIGGILCPLKSSFDHLYTKGKNFDKRLLVFTSFILLISNEHHTPSQGWRRVSSNTEQAWRATPGSLWTILTIR